MSDEPKGAFIAVGMDESLGPMRCAIQLGETSTVVSPNTARLIASQLIAWADFIDNSKEHGEPA